MNLEAAHAPELLLELLDDIDDSEADEELAVMLDDDDDDPAPLPLPPLPLLNHQLVLMANIPEGLFWSFPFPPDEFIFLLVK